MLNAFELISFCQRLQTAGRVHAGTVMPCRDGDAAVVEMTFARPRWLRGGGTGDCSRVLSPVERWTKFLGGFDSASLKVPAATRLGKSIRSCSSCRRSLHAP